MKPFKCPKCHTTTSRDQDFCINCGEALTIVCNGCSERWRYYQGYKYCPNCGSTVTRKQEVKTKKK